MPPIGQSDHDITFIEINQSLTKNKQQSHNFHIFKKANWDQIEQDLVNRNNYLETNQVNLNIDEMWLYFKHQTVT